MTDACPFNAIFLRIGVPEVAKRRKISPERSERAKVVVDGGRKRKKRTAPEPNGSDAVFRIGRSFAAMQWSLRLRLLLGFFFLLCVKQFLSGGNHDGHAKDHQENRNDQL